MLVDEQVDAVQIPGLDGYMGILPGHAPLLSELMPGGVLSYRAGGGERCWRCTAVSSKCSPTAVRVLADFAERKEEIQHRTSPRGGAQKPILLQWMKRCAPRRGAGRGDEVVSQTVSPIGDPGAQRREETA